MNNSRSDKPWRIIIPPKIARQLQKFTPKEQARIKQGIDGLQNFPHEGDLKDLFPRPEWRLAVGGRRILFRINEQERIIGITRIGPRGDVYKG